MHRGRPQSARSKKVLLLREPIWITERGDKIPLSQIKHDHLKRIERWLRGYGKTDCPPEMHAFWYGTIKSELDKRGLQELPNHPARFSIYIDGVKYEWDQETHTWSPSDERVPEDI